MINQNIAMKVSRNTVLVNIVLSVFKFIAGLIGKSQAMISDAVHSLSDVLSTFVVMIGIKISNKESDDKHPYGHERFESVSALILAIILFYTGLFIGYSSIKGLLFSGNNQSIPGTIALIGAIVSIVVKEWMYWYTIICAKKINSDSLKADAWHHRSDALSSVGSLIGIISAKMGFVYGDLIASLLICACIIKVSYDIFIDATGKMVDKACDDELLNKFIATINKNKKVKNIDNIKSRMFGNKVFLDIEIAVDKTLNISEAHAIAESVHNELENKFDIIKHCMIHVNPWKIKNNTFKS